MVKALLIFSIAACGADSKSLIGPGDPQAGVTPPPSTTEYRDPADRFTFSYPTSFGVTSPGTNDGFGDRAAAVRFSAFSALGVGGEAVLTRNRALIDSQALGGLYDPFAREALTERVLELVDAALPALSPVNFCEQLGREEHLDVMQPAFRDLTAGQRDALRMLDRMGNAGPRVLECVVEGTIVSFRKEAALIDGGPRRQVFGAVRFLDPPYATFQIVQARAQVESA